MDGSITIPRSRKNISDIEAEDCAVIILKNETKNK
jgi:hypothetical protein